MKLLRCAIHCALAGTVGFFFGRLISQWPIKPDRGWFRSFAIERNGKIYEKLNIHKWQATIPDVTKYTARSAMLNMDIQFFIDLADPPNGEASKPAFIRL